MATSPGASVPGYAPYVMLWPLPLGMAVKLLMFESVVPLKSTPMVAGVSHVFATNATKHEASPSYWSMNVA